MDSTRFDSLACYLPDTRSRRCRLVAVLGESLALLAAEMPANLLCEQDLPFSVRGVRGGWRDVRDNPEDSTLLRVQAEAAERRQAQRAKGIGEVWRAEGLEA